MKEQVSDKLKTDRSAILLSMEKEQSKQFRNSYIGKDTEVLFEETKEMGGVVYWIGHTADYVKVALCTGQNLENSLKRVRITGFLTDEVLNCNSLD